MGPFCRDGLGLPTDGIVGTEFEFGVVAFLNRAGRIKLALWPRDSKHRTRRGHARTSHRAPPTDMTLAHNVNSKTGGWVLDEVRRAGGKIIKPAADTF